MELIQVGDLHLPDSAGVGCLSKYVEQPEQMVLSELQVVVDYARDQHVKDIVLAGDLCNNPRMSYEAQLALDSFLTKNSDRQWHILPGNHDMFGMDYTQGHSLELLVRLHAQNKSVRFYLEPKTVKIGGVRTRFLPYPSVDFKRNMLNVFHNEVRGAKNDAGKAFDHEGLSSSKAVALGGHLHTAHRIRNTWFSGTLYQTNFGERLPKFFHHVEYRSDDDYEVRRIPHDPVYKLYNIVVESRGDLDSIPVGDRNLVKLVVADGADIGPSDVARFPNIVEHRNFKTKQDLASVLTEDMSHGHEVAFKVSDFFSAWIESYDVPDPLRAKIKDVRKRILNNVKATK